MSFWFLINVSFGFHIRSIENVLNTLMPGGKHRHSLLQGSLGNSSVQCTRKDHFLISWLSKSYQLWLCMLCSVAQSCPTLCNPMNCSPPGSSVREVLQARILEWVTMPSSRGSSHPRDWTQVSHIAGRFFTIWTTREAQEYRSLTMHKNFHFSFWNILSLPSGIPIEKG